MEVAPNRSLLNQSFSAEHWRQFWDYWKAQPQQLDGIEQLRLAINAAPDILTETAAWRQCFSAAALASFSNPLAVAWEKQNNNASGTGYRECFLVVAPCLPVIGEKYQMMMNTMRFGQNMETQHRPRFN
jgi:hypothetical protein